MARVASQLIDLRSHHGEHPRVGATDVMPFVPIRGVSMQECVQLARMVDNGSATSSRSLCFSMRKRRHGPSEEPRVDSRGGVKGLAARMETDRLAADFGPKQLHHTAGATVVGARWPLSPSMSI